LEELLFLLTFFNNHCDSTNHFSLIANSNATVALVVGH